MIRRLQGRLVGVEAGELVVDVRGVGYEVFCTTADQARMPPMGDTVELRVYTHLREDALQLYGFLDERDRRHFARLLQVSGVGPRLALQILSVLPGERLVEAVQSGDAQQLTRVPGIGKKTAQRLLLELAGAFDGEGAVGAATGGVEAATGAAREVEEALVALGYRESEAREAVDRALALWREERGPQGAAGDGVAGMGEQALPQVADLLRRTLRLMGSERHGT